MGMIFYLPFSVSMSLSPCPYPYFSLTISPLSQFPTSHPPTSLPSPLFFSAFSLSHSPPVLLAPHSLVLYSWCPREHILIEIRPTELNANNRFRMSFLMHVSFLHLGNVCTRKYGRMYAAYAYMCTGLPACILI